MRFYRQGYHSDLVFLLMEMNFIPGKYKWSHSSG